MRLFYAPDGELFLLHSMGLVHDGRSGTNMDTGCDNILTVST